MVAFLYYFDISLLSTTLLQSVSAKIWIFLKETPNKIIFNSIGKDDFFNTCCSKKICGRALIASGHLIILCKSTKNPGLQFEKIFVGCVKNLST